jgi:hypothetical protein
VAFGGGGRNINWIVTVRRELRFPSVATVTPAQFLDMRRIMATMTIRLPDKKHDRLKRLAERRGVSLNKLFEEWSTQALAEFDAESRFRLLSAKGNPKRALEILDQLDAAFKSKSID